MGAPASFGRYLIFKRLAAGGMGEVYVAEQTGVGDFRKPLALKVMLPGLEADPKHVKLFLAEARIAARLQHPNVVQVLDAGLIDGRYFITMELVDGVSLAGLVKAARLAGSRVDAEVLCFVARQTLDALAYVHTLTGTDGAPLDLVHRDISPSNILVSRRGEVKLTDFGIAKVRDSESHTAPGEVRGKLAYIAPELLLGATASPRSDLYALGATLYRLAALASPFSRTDESDMVATLRRELVPLAERRPDLPPGVVAAIERALAAEPTERFATAQQMLEAFPRGDLEARQRALADLVALSGHAKPPTVSLGTAVIQPPAEAALPSAGPSAQSVTMLDPVPDPVRPPADALAPAASTPGLKSPPPHARAAVLAVVALAGLVTVVGVVWPRPAPLSVPSTPVRAVVPPEPTPAPSPTPTPPAEVAPPAVPSPTPPSPVARASAEPPSGREPGRGPTDVASHPARRPPPPALLASPALLVIQAEPWANVEVNGRVVGQTPLQVPVSTPTAVVRLTNPDFEGVTLTLKLTAGEERKINQALRKGR